MAPYTFLVMVKLMSLSGIHEHHKVVQHIPMCGRHTEKEAHGSFLAPQSQHSRGQQLQGIFSTPTTYALTDNPSYMKEGGFISDITFVEGFTNANRGGKGRNGRTEENNDNDSGQGGNDGDDDTQDKTKLVILTYWSTDNDGDAGDNTIDDDDNDDDNDDNDDDDDDDNDDDNEGDSSNEINDVDDRRRNLRRRHVNEMKSTENNGLNLNSENNNSQHDDVFWKSEDSSDTNHDTYNQIFTNKRNLKRRSGRRRRTRRSPSIPIVPERNNDKHPTDSLVKCSCKITSTKNYNLYILDVLGAKPSKSRLYLGPESKQHKTLINVADFWTNMGALGIKWSQDTPNESAILKITDGEKPKSPYILVMGVSGTSDLQVQCFQGPVNNGRDGGNPAIGQVSTPTQDSNDHTQSMAALSKSNFWISPFFIGAVILCSFGLIFLIVALGLWRRSVRASKNHQKTSTGGTRHTTNRGDKTEEFYEEIPEEARSRSGSRTKLGTLSLSGVRRQSSPILNHVDRRKNSAEIKTVLASSNTAAASLPSITMTTSNPATNNLDHRDRTSQASSAVTCGIYEELPEIPQTRGSADNPPPKPFLDRESLMIFRSHSTPGHRNSCTDGDSSDSLQHQNSLNCNNHYGHHDAAHRPVLKTSLSFDEGKRFRVNANTDDTDLIIHELRRQHQQQQQHQNHPRRGSGQQQAQGHQYPFNEGEAPSVVVPLAERNIHEHTHVENVYNDVDVDYETSNGHNVTTHQALQEIKPKQMHSSPARNHTNLTINNNNNNNNNNNKSPKIASRKKACFYTKDSDQEEIVMFDNVVYQSSRPRPNNVERS